MKNPVLTAKTASVSSVFQTAGVAPSTTPGATTLMSSQVTKGMSHPPRKSVAIIADAVSMFAYSAMKNMLNFIDEYSVWYPVISSDSASGRSKGRRFVSAKAETTKRKNDSPSGSANQRLLPACCVHTTCVSVTLPTSMKTGIRLSPRPTS